MRYRDTKKALESVSYFQETGGKALSHSEVREGNGLSILDLAQYLGGIDLKKVISVAYSWLRGIIDLYLVEKFVISLMFLCCFTKVMPGGSITQKCQKCSYIDPRILQVRN